jgi:uncharacterized ferritin-like protein (DUF455 family)
MELIDFARRVLSSSELAVKLESPQDLTDDRPVHFYEIPNQPGRPGNLALDKWKSSPRVPFPTQSELHDPRNVGVLLHFFANHELLAMELMALALLRFTDAPPAFRLGVARTMLDEQRHLKSYIKKMADLGVEFGSLPVNDFFWTQCGGMKTPMDYVSRMSLTFEQANLDFASYFRDVLLLVGHSETAQLMQSVLDDEIGHVKHGLTWFRRWKPEEKSDWQAFCESLGGEINPSRAKGSVFSVDSRQRAGLSADFIDSLKIFSQSKGSLPRLSFFNPDAEEQIRLRVSSPLCLAPHLLAARDDLSSIMMFVLNEDDLLVLPRDLPRSFLLALRDCGFALPELMVSKTDERSLLSSCRDRRFKNVTPWATTPWTMKLEGLLNVKVPSAEEGQDLRHVYSKATALTVLKKALMKNLDDERLVGHELVGDVVSDPEQFERLISDLYASGCQGNFLAKKPWSASGRHRLVGEINSLPWSEQPLSLRKWFEKAWQKDESPIVQPLFERVFDISVQGRVDVEQGNTKVHVHGMTRVLNLPNGQYAGTCVGRILSGLEESHLRFWYEQKPQTFGSVENALRHFAHEAGQALAESGFRGAFGIDSFVFRKSADQFGLYPLVEINPRFTMGRVALALEKRMAPGRLGLWLHVPVSWLPMLNADSFVTLSQRWQRLMPLETHTKSGGTVILSGMLETTPAEQAERVWTCFIVGSELDEVLKKLGIEELSLFSGSPKATRSAGRHGSQL